MFGSNIVLPRGGILSYEQALAKHNSIVPIRGRNVDTRPLGQRKNDNLTIRVLPNTNSVAIRLYHTDIVVYHTDGTIDLEPYASKLTDEAVRSVFRGVITPQYTNPVGPVLWVQHKGYRIPNFATLDKDLNLIGGSEPFVHYHLDKSKANAALKQSGYKQFALWLNTQIRLGLDPRGAQHWSGFCPTTNTIRSLDMPEYYGDIARGMPKGRPVADMLATLRRAVHKYYDAIEETELAFVDDWRQLNNIRSSQRQWG
jgi:hypothetical protein